MSKRIRKKNKKDLFVVVVNGIYRIFLALALIAFIIVFTLKLFYYYLVKIYNSSIKKITVIEEQQNKNRSFKTNMTVEKVKVWDRAFVLKVNSDNGLPVGRSKVFDLNKTKHIYSWLRFTNEQFFIKNQHLVKWAWQDPLGVTVREFSSKSKFPQDVGIDHFIYYWIADVLNLEALSRKGINDSKLIGVWKVNVYIDNEFAYSDDFLVYDSAIEIKYPEKFGSSDTLVVADFVGEGKVFRQGKSDIEELPLENLMSIKENDEILVYAGYYTSLLEEQDFPNSLLITNNRGSVFRAFSLASDSPKQDSHFKLLSMKDNKSIIKLWSGGIAVLEGEVEIINSETGEKIILSAGEDFQDKLSAVRIDPYSKKFIQWDIIISPTIK